VVCTRVEGYHGSLRLMWVLRWQVLDDGHSLSDERYVMKRMLVQVQHLCIQPMSIHTHTYIYIYIYIYVYMYISFIYVCAHYALMQVRRVSLVVSESVNGSGFH
jgi:hypothetical protein